MTNFNGHEVELPQGAQLIKSARAFDFVSYMGWTIYTLNTDHFIIEDDLSGEMMGPFNCWEQTVNYIVALTDPEMAG